MTEFSALDFPTLDKLPTSAVHRIENGFALGDGSATMTLVSELRKTLPWYRRRKFDRIPMWEMVSLLRDYMVLSHDSGARLLEREMNGGSDERDNA